MGSNKFVTEGFSKTTADTYDERNKKLQPINDNMHLLMRLILNDLPENAHVLNLGAGTGAELIAMAKAFPKWTFTGIEPAASMLEGAQRRVDSEGLGSRVKLINGYLSDFKSDERYDAALCLLVMHFVDRQERRKMYHDIASRMKPGGRLVVSEISVEFEDPAFPELFKNWLTMHRHSGLSTQSEEGMMKQLRDDLPLIPARETEDMIETSGFSTAVLFFQSLFIKAWHARKESGSAPVKKPVLPPANSGSTH